MKKIVGILGMAAVLASAAFAADPAANFVMTEFKGSASFAVKGDFVEDDAKFGMFNDFSSSLKFGFVTAGEKTSTGDGVWGEIQIATDKVDYAPSAATTTIKVPKMKDDGTVEKKDGKVVYEEVKVANTNAVALPKPSVKKAKIHFVDGDFKLALDILKPGLVVGDVAAPAATGLNVATTKRDLTGGMKAGFGIELGLDKVFGFNFRFMDKGYETKAKDQKYGLAFDASLLAIENLTAKVSAAFNFESKDNAFGAEAGYKLAIDDKLYVKPGVAFNMYKADKVDAVNSLEAGVLFGWGAADQEPGFKWVSNKTTEGISVGYLSDLKKTNTIVVGLYDQSLMSLLGDDFGTLKTGAAFKIDMTKGADDKVTNTLMFALGARYSIDIDPIYLNLGADVKMDKVGDAEAVSHYLINAKLGSKKIIDNTDVYVEYNVGDEKSTNKKIDTHNITIGTTISL